MNIYYLRNFNIASSLCCLLVITLTVSCSKTKNLPEAEKKAGQQPGMTTNSVGGFTNIQALSGEEIFRAIYFLDGALADSIHSLQGYKAELDELSNTTPEITTIRHDIAVEIASIIHAQDPSFFVNFKASLSSPNLYQVKDALINAGNLIEGAGLASEKYRNLFKLGSTVVNDPAAYDQIQNIISGDTLFNNGSTGNLNSLAVNQTGTNGLLPPPPPMHATSLTGPPTSPIGVSSTLKLTLRSKIALDSLTMEHAPEPAELFVCTPGIAICIYYLIAVAHSAAAVSYTLVGAVNMVGYFTVIVKTKAWFWSKVITPRQDFRHEILTSEISFLFANQINP